MYRNLTVPRRLNPRSVLIIAETATVVVIRMSKFKYYIITNIDLNIVIRILIVKLFIYLIYIIAIINYSLIRNLISYRYIIISEIKKIQNIIFELLTMSAGSPIFISDISLSDSDMLSTN